jgi:DNA-binding MarR family transcriptional regulator
MADGDVVDEHVRQWGAELAGLDPLTEGIVTRMQRIVALLARRAQAALQDQGLAPGEYLTLHALRRRGTPYVATASELAADLLVPPQTMTSRLDSLERRGHVVRERDDRDRRRVQVRMTDEGARVWEAALEQQALAEKELVAALPDAERRRLDGSLRRLLASLEGRQV